MAFLNLFKPSFSRTYPNQEWPNAAKVPDLYGKTAIVLGENQGIGYSIALELARKRATVFVTTRTVEKGNRAAESIKK
jgi:5,10-methylene-tetrahydrofolate dehydrogenase/methenyl tetrahydrofolate cyclohydrolase